MTKLVDIPTYRREYFAGRAPDARTVRRWIIDGLLPGEKRGRLYFVDVDRLEKVTGNELADAVLDDDA